MITNYARGQMFLMDLVSLPEDCKQNSSGTAGSKEEYYDCNLFWPRRVTIQISYKIKDHQSAFLH